MEEDIALAASATNDGEEDEQHPWLYLNTMFSYMRVRIRPIQ